MTPKHIISGILFTLVLFTCHPANSQNITYFTGAAPAINTYAQTQSGGTTLKYLTLQTSLTGANYAAGWTLNVRANGDFMNGTSSVPSQYVSLKFNSAVSKKPTGISGSQVALTGSDAVLLNSTSSLNGIYYMAQDFDMTVQGGNQLLVPTTGTYSTTLTLTLKDKNGIVIATNNSPITVSFTISYSNSCSGLALTAGFTNGPNFSTYASISSGATASQAISLQYTPNAANCIGWSLKVKANGNFTNGSSSVTPDHVSLQFNSVTSGSPSAAAIGISSNPVALSTSDVTLINNSNAPFQNYTAQAYDMIVQGGNYLLAGATGTYQCPLTFSLYNSSGQLVATSNVTASFQISYSNSSSYTITVNNPTVSFQFNTPAAYNNGVTVTEANGLTIKGYASYEVIAKTTDANLMNGSNAIPVSVIQLANSAPAGMTAITSTTINLSTADQVIITNPLPDYTYQSVQYNLQYSIAGGNSHLFSIPVGNYSTQLIFVVLAH